MASRAESSSLVSPSWNIRDEYAPSAAVASVSFKRPTNTNSSTTSPATLKENTDTSVSRQRAEEIVATRQRANDATRTVLKSFGMGDNYWGFFGYDSETKQFTAEDGIFTRFFLTREQWEERIVPGAYIDGVYQPGLFEEIIDALNKATVDGKPLPEVMHAEYTKDESELNEEIAQLRSDIYKTSVDKYNEMYRYNPKLQITDFSMRIDDKGRLTITDIRTNGNDPKTNAQAAEFINRRLSDGIRDKAELLGFDILYAHHCKNGDVLMPGTVLEPLDDGLATDIERFRHEIVIPSGFDLGFQVLALVAERFR
jgi:hypothetical protein